MSEVEVFLDDTPGEVRGMVMRDGRFHHLIIHRDDDPPQHRLGARVVGRVVEADPGHGGAFVDIGADPPFGYLPLGRNERRVEGERIEALVLAEPRERKGPVLRRVGPGQGAPRLLEPGPDIVARLDALAPGIAPVTGVAAIQASWDAEEEALADGDFFAEWGLDLSLQRTRALIAADIDYAHLPGRDARKGRERANRHGLAQAARLLSLKSWGGLVVIDLVGAGLDGQAVLGWARSAFAGRPEVGFGPLSRFGLLQLSTPWVDRPIEDLLTGWDGARAPARRAIATARRLKHALLSDPSVPRLFVSCAPDEAQRLRPLVARLGPRAQVRPDSALGRDQSDILEG